MRHNSKAHEYFKDGQIAKAIYLRHMSSMKEILNLGEIKFGSRKSDPYKYFKKVVMDAFYNGMSDCFEAMEREGVLHPCPCGTTIREGYKPCPMCNGAGHCNSDAFDAWFHGGQDDEEPAGDEGDDDE